MRTRFLAFTTVLLSSVFFMSNTLLAAPVTKRDLQSASGQAAIYVEDKNGQTLFEQRATEPLVPASILKVLTAATALKVLGPEYRFKTEFYLAADNTLYVKGYGNPVMTSEELAIVASQLATRVKSIRHLALDDSYFDSDLEIDGVANSLNPYDALNGALVANFNSANILVSKSGVKSAEEQTPTIRLFKELAKGLNWGKHRVSLPKRRALSLRYYAELLTAFLAKKNCQVFGEHELSKVPKSAKLIYVHQSSKNLAEVVKDMLEYSTNFTANQLVLIMGAERMQAPATLAKGVKVLEDVARQDFALKDVTLAEGSGLSRRNRISARSMVKLLKNFGTQYKDLLSSKHPPFKAKTGSLSDVSSLAGFMTIPAKGEVVFAIIANGKVSFESKFELGRMLYEYLSGR